MKPLIANPKRQSEAAVWHKAVFAAWGHACFFCGHRATDACHVIPRSQLGPLRYQMPVQNGRPGCRTCHNAVDAGEKEWPLNVLRIAVRAHNKIAKIALPLP